MHNLQVPAIHRPTGVRAGFMAAVDDPVSGLHHAGEQWVPAQFLIDQHRHPVWELYLQIHGQTRWQVAGRTHTLQPNDLMAVAPHAEHRLLGPVAEAHHFFFAAIDVTVAEQRHPGPAACWRDLPTVVVRAGAETVAEAFAQLMRELTAPHDFAHEGLCLAVDHLVLAATRSIRSNRPVSRLSSHPAVATVRDLLDRQYGEAWTLAGLADLVGLAPTYLAGLFTAEVGEPPHRYLVRKRVERARQLLETSDLTITATALSLGFASSQHFARVFRQLVGVSPSAFRLARTTGAQVSAD